MAFGVGKAKAAVERRRARVKIREDQLKGARRKLERAKQRLEVVQDGAQWAGSRAVTNDVIRIVDGRAAITSRKRAANNPLSLQNPGSDHSAGNVTADAVDFGIADAYDLGSEIAAKLGGAWDTDYETFTTRWHGNIYRVQIIAGTHGTGPHLHVGVRLLRRL